MKKKATKSLGLPNKSGRSIVGALAENQIVKHLEISNWTQQVKVTCLSS